MSKVITQRMTTEIEGDFVVFLIGMRVNRWWKIHKWLPVLISMPKMLIELSRRPESGMLSYQTSGGFPPLIVQYWRSFEHLEAYAKDASQSHLPAWAAFNRRIRNNGDVGIWHETYKVSAGQYETLYNNMPPFGLGKAGKLVPVGGRSESARERIAPHSNS